MPIAVFGMSHGGADPVIINALKAMKGRSSIQWLTDYVALMALTVQLASLFAATGLSASELFSGDWQY